MKRFLSIHLSVFVTAIMLLTACDSPLLNVPDDKADGRTVRLHISGFTMIPFAADATASPLFSRASASVAHLDMVVFDANGTKVAKFNQHEGDDKFGEPTLTLEDGTYTLVIIAHNGTGIATITSPEEVTFPSNKVTDTFYACQPLVVSESTTSQNITLTRPVAMVRVVLTDKSLPENFSRLQLYYTGGSSTFNPSTGFGSKSSRQTELRDLADAPRDAEGHPRFEIYTFPHEAEDVLKLTLTPMDDKGTAIETEKVLNEVPVRINYITEAAGLLFPNTTSSNTSSLAITINDAWSGTTPITF